MLDSLEEKRVRTLIKILGKPSANRVYEESTYTDYIEEYNWSVAIKSQRIKDKTVVASILYRTGSDGKPLVEVLERGTREAYFLNFNELNQMKNLNMRIATIDEGIRNLEMRLARLERQSTKEKTLFERVSDSDKKKVHEVLRDEMIENYTPDRDPVESSDGETLDARFRLKYKVPLRPIYKVLSRFFRQEVTREDLQPFLDDFYPEEMNLNGSPEDIERSGFYDIWDFGDYYSDELIYSIESSRLTRISTEIEIEDVDGEYLIANAYIRIY